jgi:hypothetical protein
VPPRAAPGRLAPARYTYVFTTGGIGSTHGDITADCVAKAFGVTIDSDPRALAILHEWVETTGAEMNEARLRLTPSVGAPRKPSDLLSNLHRFRHAAASFCPSKIQPMCGAPRIFSARRRLA